MRRYAATLAVLAWAGVAWGEPPKLTIPAEVKPTGQYVQFVPETDAVSVLYVGLSGIEPIPASFLSEKRGFLLDTYGKPAGVYKFVAVAAGKDGEQSRADFTVRIGAAKPVDPPKEPPGSDPPATPATGLYFLVVRPDGPAHREFAAYMGSPGWGELLKAGHLVKDKTLGEAASLGVAIPPGTALPAVVTLRVAADGKSSKVLSVRPTPAPAEIVKLPEGQ